MDLDKRLIPLLFLGLITGAFFGCLDWFSWIIPVLLLISTLYLYLTYFVTTDTQKDKNKSIILFVVLLMLFSWGYISLRKPVQNTHFIINQSCKEQGNVISQPLYYPNSVWFHVKTPNGKVQCKLSYTESKIPEIEIGSSVYFEGIVEDVSKYSEEATLYLKKRDIVASVLISQEDRFAVQSPKNIVRSLLNRIRSSIETNISIATRNRDDLTGILKAIMINQKKGVDVNAYAELGIAHLLSISGMHFTIVSILLLAIFLLLPFSQIYKTVFFELLLLFYLSIIGFPLPAVRAFIMISFVSLSLLVKRKTEPFYALMIAAFILVVMKPFLILSISFWFSFLATAALCIPGSGFQKTIYLFVTISLVSAYSFHMISIISLVSSVFFSFFLIPFFTWGLFSIILPGVSSLLLYPLFSILYDGLLFFARAFRSIPGSYRFIPFLLQDWIAVLIGIVFILYIVSYYTGFCKKSKHFITFVLCIAVLILFIPIHTSNTRVAFFNVGDGDSIFIQSPHGNILIDVGEWEGDYCPAKTTIVPYLKKWGINHIDAILLTHYHSDHYGGIPYIISRIPEIDVLLLPDTNSLDKKVFIEHMVQKDGFKIPCKNVDQKMVFKESEESSFVIFPVYKLYSAEMTMNENDNSIISKYLCGNISFLFTGDLEANGEEALLSYSRNQLHSTVLKVGHHGSNTSTTDEFLEAVKPKYAIISCGKYSYCKHPSNKVLERLKAHSIPVETTHNKGTIVLETDGRTVWFAEE